MKIKEGFMLREVAKKHIIVPIGDKSVDFNGLITTNETGAFIWNSLETDKNISELVSLLMEEYDIDRETAEADVNAFISKLKDAELIEE